MNDEHIPEDSDYQQAQAEDEEQMLAEAKEAMRDATKEELAEIIIRMLEGGRVDIESTISGYRERGYI